MQKEWVFLSVGKIVLTCVLSLKARHHCEYFTDAGVQDSRLP